MSRFKGPDAEESVACNLIPMIDIMFLLLLFFMLGADMSQREIESVKLPIAEQVKEDPKVKEGYETYTVNITHTDVACAAYEKGGHCSAPDHWVIKIKGHEFPDWNQLKAYLLDLAKDHPEPGAQGNPAPSRDAVMIRGDALAPCGMAQRLIETCGAVGLYKVEIGAAKPPPESPPK